MGVCHTLPTTSLRSSTIGSKTTRTSLFADKIRMMLMELFFGREGLLMSKLGLVIIKADLSDTILEKPLF
jgi:hypothetical protein